MRKEFNLQGDINKRGTVTISLESCFYELLHKEAGGMKDYKRLRMIQVGGPLGPILSGLDIRNKLSDYYNDVLNSEIYFFNEKLCSVDYFRFLTRYMIREIKLDTDRMRTLNNHVENIAQGKATTYDLNQIEQVIAEKPLTRADQLFNQVANQLINKFKTEFIDHIEEKKCLTGMCRTLVEAQCINACPSDIHIPGYVELMKRHQFEEAYMLMRQENPLSFICGKVCARPCEESCRRKEIESTVGVRALQRFASRYALENTSIKEDTLAPKNKSVGIVGAGPCGLSSAYYLARSGYDVTIYESQKHVGGMLAFGVPEYRLPYEDILKEVKLIEDLGVNILTNTKVGKDVEMSDLKNQHHAVLLASGCHVGNRLKECDDPNIETAVDFLREVRLEDRKTIGNRVLVVGGGDVAMDAARTALRLGAEVIELVSLEKRHEMPASKEEIEQALEENIHLRNGWGIQSIEKTSALKVVLNPCTQVWDEAYAFRPEFDPRKTLTINYDSILLAIGQKPDLSYLSEENINIFGFVNANAKTFKTDMEGIFAAGDVMRPSIAIEAIANGKKVARRIDHYLGGTGLYKGKVINIPETPLNIRTWDDPLQLEKQMDVEERKYTFEEVSKAYSMEDAKCEASRCMRCDRNSRQHLKLVPKRS